MKKVQKELLNKTLSCFRDYRGSDGDERYWAFVCFMDFAASLDKKTKCQKNTWSNLIHSILSDKSLCYEASNKQIYEILKILGWEVVDE